MTELLPPGGWIILTGALTAISCALVGSFLVLRRMAMLGDAISHAVLPGIVLAFLWTGSRSSPAILLGAGALGLLTAVITEFLHKTGRLQADAAIGVTFTWLFALGVILVSALAGQVDLDQDCVLYGEIAYVPWDPLVWNGMDLGPRPVWLMGGLTLLMLAFVLLGWSRLKLISFDPALAASLGVSVGLWHYLLMGAVSMTTVASFEIVGAILVVAMLVAPAATAYLLTDRLAVMIALAALFGVLSSALGYAMATALNASIAGSMGVVAGVLYALALVFGPRHGILARRRAMKLLPVAALLFLLFPPPAAAYDLFHPRPRESMRELSTDRPDITESPYTVDAGHFQLEADAVSFASNKEDDQTTETFGLAELNLKAGLTDRSDLQLVIPVFLRESSSEPSADGARSGVGDLSVRVKWNAFGNDAGATALAFMPFITLPVAADGLGVAEPTIGLIVPFSVDLAPGWGLGTMVEADWVSDGEDRSLDLVTSLVVGRDVTSTFGAFVEGVTVVSTAPDGPFQALLNGGVTLALSPNARLDGGVRVGLTDSTEDLGLFLGLALRR
ncbi:MAG: manganese/zinc/iron transport system permease protein [bacterium]|nr:MAG: manganese/zinc/iron transport system permease protein [bacterium]